MIAQSLLDARDASELKIFFSYSRKRPEWVSELCRALARFDEAISARLWMDTSIRAGDEWAERIDENLHAADIVLLLIGQDFIASDYCMNVELPAALARHDLGEARVIPILFEDTSPDWRNLPFAKLQAAPQDGRAVASWSRRGDGLAAAAERIVEVITRQGVHHETSVRWDLIVSAAADAAPETQRDVWEQALRRHARCATLRITDIRDDAAIETAPSPQKARPSGVLSWLRQRLSPRRATAEQPEAARETSSNAAAIPALALSIESTEDGFRNLTDAIDAGDPPRAPNLRVLSWRKLFGAVFRSGSSPAEAGAAASWINEDFFAPTSPRRDAVEMRAALFRPEDPLFTMQTIIRTGDDEVSDEERAAASEVVTRLFLEIVATPEQFIFVNLAPGEQASLLAPCLADTLVGVTLLEFDVKLKCMCASLLHPDLDTGRDYWREVSDRLRATGVDPASAALNAFQRVWVHPEDAQIYYDEEREASQASAEGWNSFHVLKRKLGVATERDYLGLDFGADDPVSAAADSAFRNVVLPTVQEEVDGGVDFAPMRQLFSVMLLATSYKSAFAEHPNVARFIDSGDPKQLAITSTTVNRLDRGADGAPRTPIGAADDLETLPDDLARRIGDVGKVQNYDLPENKYFYDLYADLFRTGVFRAVRDGLEEARLRRQRVYFAGGVDFRRTTLLTAARGAPERQGRT